MKLKPLVREYVESLSTIHERFRQLTTAATEAQLEVFRELKFRLFLRNTEIDDVAIAVFPGDGNGIKMGKETDLSSTFTDYLTLLRDKNKHLIKFSARRITY